MKRLLLILLLLLVCEQSVSASMRFGSRSIRDTVTSSNTVSTISQQSGCPDAANTGEVHFTDLTESFDCDGDEGFTFTQSSNLVNINESTDGDSILLRLDNDLANSAGSTNETAQIRFGFGTDTDAARIVAGKVSQFTDSTTSDAFIDLYVDTSGTSQQVMRGWGIQLSSEGGGANNIYGVTVGSTRTGNATLEVNTAGITVNDRGFLVTSTLAGSTITDVLKTVGDNTVIAGDTDYTSAVTLEVISGGRAVLLAQGTQLFNAPASLQLSTTTGTTYTSSIEIVDIASPTFQRYADWGASDLASVQAESPIVIFNSTPVQVVALANATTLTNQRAFIFNAQTINGIAGGGTETVTNAATVYIDAAPSGSNITITNPYALWVDDGAVRFDGTVTLSSSVTNEGDITIKKADPTLIYDVVTATDTDFWAGVQDDAGSDDDDTYQIGKGTTPGTTPLVTVTGGGAVGVGVTPSLGILHLDRGTGIGQITMDGSTGGCLMLRDTDDAGWTECDALDGVLTCSIDADGVCD